MLNAGARLGTYRVVSAVGAGGMGEVYKATDTRLDRTVAIKVLPEHLSKDPALRERFEREARAVSSLNHPHICTLHDVGEHDGVYFLVMEYIEGETLAERLKKGALPLAQALEYAAQIADALDKAHREGIVHRDLKPGNLMLTKPGVKLLDFGLATRLRQGFGETRGTSDSSNPTQQKPLTDAGTILGTVQYMAPEQLEGKDVDARADLFALGAILFEMVTGRKAFEGESKASLISAIMGTDPPPVSELQSVSPPALDRIVKNCLDKDPAERWHSAHDLKTELDWLGSATSAQLETRSGTRPWRWATAAMAVLLATSAAALILRESPPPVEPLHLDIKLQANDTLAVGQGRPGVTLSPDGSRLAYVASRDDGPRQIFVRPLDGFEATPLAGTESAQYPFFSPDGESIVFLSRESIQSVSLRGGAPVRLAPYDGFSFAGGDWLPNGDMVLGAWNYPLRRVSSTDGSLEDITVLGPDRMGHAWPDVLPGGKAVVFTGYPGGGMENAVVAVELLETGERRTLFQGVSARYIPSGHLVYVREQNLMAAPFDVESLAITGPAVPVISDIRITPAWSPDVGISDRGDVVYIAGSSAMARSLEMADNRDLRIEAYNSVRASPRGDRLAVGLFHELAEAWVYDLPRDTLTRLLVGDDAHAPIWSPDASQIVFTSNRDGRHNLHAIAADGSGQVQRLTTSPNHQFPGSISPDGRFLAYTQGRSGASRDWDIYLLPLEGLGEPTPLLTTNANEYSPMFSPDGNWLAYVSEESAESAVYVQPFPGPGPKTQISAAGAHEPVWSPDGRELHYVARNGTITSVELHYGLHYDQGLRAGASQVRRPGGTVSASIDETAYDVMPDGSLVVIRRSNRESVDIHFVANWFEELKRLAPPEN